MSSNLRVKNEADNVIVEIYGTIGEDWWSEGVTMESVNRQLKEIPKDKEVTVRINSYGGDVNDALAIYDLLRKHGKITTECYGLCASAATIIAMAGDVRKMSRYALFLVHQCVMNVYGNEADTEAALEAQRTINDRIAQIYADTTGTDKDEIVELMAANSGDGRWIDVKEAMDYKFITEEISTERESASAKAIYNHFRNIYKTLNSTKMKKSITNLAALCAVLAVEELNSTKDGMLMSDEQLLSINNKIDELTNALNAAEEAKQEAENKVAAAEAEKDAAVKAKDVAEEAKTAAEKKAAELQNLVEQKPNTAVNGEDPKGETSFHDWYKEQQSYKDACRELGIEE